MWYRENVRSTTTLIVAADKKHACLRQAYMTEQENRPQTYPMAFGDIAPFSSRHPKNATRNSMILVNNARGVR